MSLGQSLREARKRATSLSRDRRGDEDRPRYLEARERPPDVMPAGLIKGSPDLARPSVSRRGVLARYKSAGLIGEPSASATSSEDHGRPPALPPPLAPRPSSSRDGRCRRRHGARAGAPHRAGPRQALPRARSGSSPDVEDRRRLIVVASSPCSGPRAPAPPAAKPGALATGPPSPGTPCQPRATGRSRPTPRPPGPKLEPAPAADEVWSGVTIEITFHAETWITVRTDGEIKIDGLFPAGPSARARADELLLISTGNPAASPSF